MTDETRVFLVFNGAWLEVDASLAARRGGLRAIARKAQNTWNLQPNLFEIRHANDKVDSPEKLQRALESVSAGVCKLEIEEHAEGRMMRNMQNEMKLMEERVMAKMEGMLADVRKENEWTGNRLSHVVAPMVQCLATEQIELRNKLNGSIAPMVQCLATEQIELRNTVGDLTAEAATVRDLKDAEKLELELQEECAKQSACDLDMASLVNVEEAKEEVLQLSEKSEKQVGEASNAKPLKSTIEHVNPPTAAPKPNYCISYSSKSMPAPPSLEAKYRPFGEKIDSWSYDLGNEAAVPFAPSVIASHLRFSKSTFASRSCPLLPPLQ
jgi:hypothetical protein